MPAGLSVSGSTGYAQIDQNYRNYHCVQSFTMNGGAGGLAPVRSNLSRNALWAVIPLAHPGICPTPGGFFGGQRWFNFWFWVGSNVPVQVYVFDMVTPLGTRCGLEVYDGAGALVFDGEGYPMKVVGIVQTASQSIYPVPTGSSYAICPLFGGNRVQDDGPGADVEVWSTYFIKQSTYLEAYTSYETAAGSAILDIGVQPLTGLLLDVTGIPVPFLRA